MRRDRKIGEESWQIMEEETKVTANEMIRLNHRGVETTKEAEALTYNSDANAHHHQYEE